MPDDTVAVMDIAATYQRGFDLRCEGRYSEAKRELQTVLASEPGHVLARWQIALIQGFEGDFDGSLAALSILCEANPTQVEIRYDLAMTQMMLGMNDEACANFREVLRLDATYDKAKKQLVYC